MLERIAIIGSGNWGSCIAKIVGGNARRLSGIDPAVRIWVHDELFEGRKLTDWVNQDHENPKYLPGVKIPENVVALPSLTDACQDASLLIFVLPHQFLKGICQQLKAANCLRQDVRAISLIKGLDAEGHGLEMASDVIKASLGLPDVSVMMGANIANEVARECFCESTIGYACEKSAQVFKSLFETDYFRLALVPEVLAVELLGALKNVIALAAGIVDGLLMGDNTKAAIIRIGMAEMRRLIRLLRGDDVAEAIYWESCGLADLITTCFGGRNRRIAEAFVTTGKPFEQLEAELLGGQRLQGPPTAREVYRLLTEQKLLDDFPLLAAIHRICFEGAPPRSLFAHL